MSTSPMDGPIEVGRITYQQPNNSCRAKPSLYAVVINDGSFFNRVRSRDELKIFRGNFLPQHQ